jgi:nucleotide-binding universal stress UspA family protein
MRILIGFNGSEASMAALRDLRFVGFPNETEILILTVVEAWDSPKTTEVAESISTTAKAAVVCEFPNLTVSAEIANGSPARELLARAESFKPNLIVVGEPAKNRRGSNMFLGQTSQTILTEAECSVRIARDSADLDPHPARILVGFDGSVGSVHAVESITSRMSLHKTEVKLLAVADSSVMSSIGRFTPQMKDAAVKVRFATQWAETLAAASLEKLKKVGISSSVEVRPGHPKDVIIAEAQSWNADTIFVGPHCSLNSFERFMLGSVSAAVAARAHCSVEITRFKANETVRI